MTMQSSDYGAGIQQSSSGALVHRRSKINNPYRDADWDTVQQAKANFHTHTDMSDGTSPPHVVIDAYDVRDYDILALTDHDYGYSPDIIVYPWTGLNSIDESWENRDPSVLGMVSVSGVEVTATRHTLSHFCAYTGGGENDIDTALADISLAGGLATFAHPSMYPNPYDFCLPRFQSTLNSHLVGIEVYNGVVVASYNDVATWDALLAALMPGRNVWGFANDDAHGIPGHVGRCYNIMLVPSLTLQNVRDSYQYGMFFFCLMATNDSPAPPVIGSITDTGSAIVVEATGYDTIHWVSEDGIVGDSLTYDYVSNPFQKYLRLRLVSAVVDGKYSETNTQPFGISSD